jgi:Zn-dependent M28 family amino/carboxypeptidase
MWARRATNDATSLARLPRKGSDMREIRLATLVCTSVLGLCGALLIPPAHLRAQAPGPPAAEKSKAKAPAEPGAEAKAVTQAILDEIDKNSELMANIEYLCDMIGPRLTGSPGLARASQWTRDKFKQYGLANVHLEPWTIHRAWTRGEGKGRVTAPVEQRLLLESAGWVASTRGPVRGPVVHLKAESSEELSPYKGKLKGAWVLQQAVSVQPSPKQPGPASPMAAMMRRMRDFPRMMKFNQELKAFLAAEGAAGLLRDSNKEHGLVNMTGATSNYTEAPYPEVFLTTESYGLIWRLLKRGPVEVEIELKNSFSDGPVEVHNTVAEIPGGEKPDEVVILGGHIDSWDLGTGATDDGTGIMAVLEAARALKAVGVKPRRTIRFVMFSGEEQGLHGSRAYVKAHEQELPRISAVLVHDMGTGRVKSIGLLGRYDLRETMDQVVEPFREAVKLDELSLRGMAGGTDHASFVPFGVPAFAVIQDEAEYRKTHHTESDTFDKVYADEINQGTKVLAAWAYNVAMLPEVLPRNPKPARPGMFDAPQFQQPGEKSGPSPAQGKPGPVTASGK